MEASFPFAGLTGHYYGLVLAAATALLLLLMGLTARRRRLPPGTVPVFGALAIPLGLLGARLVFCLFNLSLFTETYENPLLMLRFFDGGLSLYGLFPGLVLAAFLTSRIVKAGFGQLMDVLVLPLGLWLCLARLAEGFTELGVGKVVEESAVTRLFPWLFIAEQAGVATEYRMAVYRYEAAAGLLLFLFMLGFALRKQPRKARRAGDSALVFFALFGAAQVLLESLRDDGHMLLIFLRVGQVLAAAMPLLAAGVFTRRVVALRGRWDRRTVLSWALLLLCVGACVLLEFSLDGRLTWGTPSMLRDYLLMAVACAGLFAVPWSLRSAKFSEQSKKR